MHGVVVERDTARPLAGVAVSDGLVVTGTDGLGAFALPERADAEFVFVTVPSTHHALIPGWYADVSSGSDEPLRFELDARVAGASAGCRFVQVTDLHVSVDDGARLRPLIETGVHAPAGVHVTGETTAELLREDLDAVVRRAQPDFIVATGDLADYGQREELEAYRDAIGELDVPVASVPGNHDHLSCLTREAIDEFFRDRAAREHPDGESAGDAFQRDVFGGDWRRATSGRAPWLGTLGPLYYSFDWGGVHFVAYDGEGLRRYGDDYPQDRWLAADLALVRRDMPVVVCTHFPEPAAFYESRFAGVRLVASMCGHWHGTRLWTNGEARHWTSSTLGFGGIDFTPRGYRVLEVDQHGARSRWDTMDAPSPAERVTGDPAVVAGRVIVALERADGSGYVRAMGAWDCELGAAARGGVVADDDRVYALDTGAELHAVDARTGAPIWSARLGERSERWALGCPVVADDTVYAGSARSVGAFDARDGATRWHTALASADWAATWSGVAVDGDVVIIGAASDDVHLAALEAATGVVRWQRDGRDIAGVTATPVITGDTVLAVHAPGWLRAYARADGSPLWKAPLDDAWPVALAIDDARAFVRSSTGHLLAFGIDNGSPLWTAELAPALRAGRPYGRQRAGDRGSLLVVDGAVWTPCANDLVALDTHTGAVVHRIETDREIAAAVYRDGVATAVCADATVVGA